MGKVIGFIIVGAIFFFGYLYLVADPESQLCQTLLVPLGLVEKVNPEEEGKGRTLDDIEKLAEGMDKAKRWAIRSDIISYMDALKRCNATELLNPPLENKILLEHAPWYIDQWEGCHPDPKTIPRLLEKLDRLHQDWGVSHCDDCENTYLIGCPQCNKDTEDTKKEDAKKEELAKKLEEKREKQKQSSTSSALSSSALTATKYVNRLDSGRRITEIKGLGSKTWTSGSGKKPSATTKISGPGKKTASASKSSSKKSGKAISGNFTCGRCDGEEKIPCPTCVGNARKRMEYHGQIMQAELNKLLPLFAK